MIIDNSSSNLNLGSIWNFMLWLHLAYSELSNAPRPAHCLSSTQYIAKRKL